MNYQQYRALRDQVVAASDPWRLDCMNPVKALAAFAPAAAPGLAATPNDVRAAWLALFQAPAATDQVLATSGVRPALNALFALLARRGCEVWLPEDVYPVYGELAGRH